MFIEIAGLTYAMHRAGFPAELGPAVVFLVASAGLAILLAFFVRRPREGSSS